MVAGEAHVDDLVWGFPDENPPTAATRTITPKLTRHMLAPGQTNAQTTAALPW